MRFQFPAVLGRISLSFPPGRTGLRKRKKRFHCLFQFHQSDPEGLISARNAPQDPSCKSFLLLYLTHHSGSMPSENTFIQLSEYSTTQEQDRKTVDARSDGSETDYLE